MICPYILPRSTVDGLSHIIILYYLSSDDDDDNFIIIIIGNKQKTKYIRVTIRYCEGIQWQIIKQVVVVVVILMRKDNDDDTNERKQ